MGIQTRPRVQRLLLACFVVTASLAGGHAHTQTIPPPNILFIILDDVGKDQLAVFNPAAATGVLTPTLNTIAAAGVQFTNFYAMPECSPSRSAFFTGRYPFRTGVTAAILDLDLPAAHVSPYEVTTPRVLASAGYTTALLGKYHLGGPENNPDGNNAPVALGWNYFDGNLRGGPPPIDTTLGGQFTENTARYSCGFPTTAAPGAAWFQDANGRVRCDDNQGAGYTGQQAVALGGISALDAQGDLAPTCGLAAGSGPDFTIPNGYYVWPQAVASAAGVQTVRSRRYMTTAQTDAAIDWIRSQSATVGPWMATVSYNAIHTPYQPPPVDLLPPGFAWPSIVPQNCTSPGSQRILSALMLAAMDREIGRLLVGAGLAQRGPGGQLVYQPAATNTMVIVVGDNGTFLTSVLPPYDPIRAKGTAYETGVTAPLIVSGPLVAEPGRQSPHLVNAVDLFQLFGEIAGVDVRAAVPTSHLLDAQPMRAYLTNPAQPSVREANFVHLGTGLKPTTVKLWPCVIQAGPINIATDILFTSQSLCEGYGGTWFGPTADQPTPQYPTSCAIKEAGLFSNLTILPNRVWAIRNDRYKVVKVERPSCDAGLGEYEFYDLSPNPPLNPIGLDLAPANLLTNGQPIGLTADQLTNGYRLVQLLQELLDSERPCPGDGNLDKRVDAGDVLGIIRYQGGPSVFDFTQDGVTDIRDYQVISDNLGTVCQ